MSPADVSIINIGPLAGRIAAFEHGKVYAVMIGEPGATQLLKRYPNTTVLADTRTAQGVRQAFGLDVYPAMSLVASAQWLGNNPDKARRLANAIKNTLRWMHERTPEKIAERVPASMKGEDPGLYLELSGQCCHSTHVME